jgi:hypothetical protein
MHDAHTGREEELAAGDGITMHLLTSCPMCASRRGKWHRLNINTSQTRCRRTTANEENRSFSFILPEMRVTVNFDAREGEGRLIPIFRGADPAVETVLNPRAVKKAEEVQ